MAYADAQTLQQRSAGIAGAAIAHAAIGGLIIVGLTVTTGIVDEEQDFGAVEFELDPPPPPPNDPVDKPKPKDTRSTRDVVVPDTPIDIAQADPFELSLIHI